MGKAFSGLAQRQKDFVDTAKHKLEDLQHEIDEVMAHPGEDVNRAQDKEKEPVDREDRDKLLERIKELEYSLHLHQKTKKSTDELLDCQLHFLISMRDNTPEKNKDPDVI